LSNGPIKISNKFLKFLNPLLNVKGVPIFNFFQFHINKHFELY
jgi:hypothetical protein